MRKPFDKKLFEENDARARAAVAKALNEDGVFCIPNDDKYGPDLKVFIGFKHKYYVECEIKLGWVDGDFPFDSVQLPERKQKFTRNGNSTPTGKLPKESSWKPVEFWVFRADMQMVVIIPENVLNSSMLKDVPNSKVESGEKFFQVPLDQCLVRKL